MRLARRIALAVFVLLLVVPRSAFADATLFLGANMSPANRTAKGLAIGTGLLFLGFEFEYADTTDDLTARAPNLKTGMGNLLLQTPGGFFGIQPYYTIGGGVYHEDLAASGAFGAIDNTGFGMNTGGGVKISLIGPIRLRVDYRVFSLKQNANTSPVHRVYAGINLKF